MNNSALIALSLLWLISFATTAIAAQHENADIDFDLLTRQAEMANASYQSIDSIADNLKKYQYSLDIHRQLEDSQISFYLATNEKQRIQTIAVRGTSNLDNVLVNISLELVADDSTGLLLHRGYTETAAKLLAELRPSLKKDYSINAIGHSLGGAVALILAVMLEREGYRIDQVVTFGQPKVGNITAAAKMQHLNILRVVTAADPVPLLPLLDPLDINNVKIYWHAGKELLLLDGSQYAIIEGMASMLRATDISPQTINEEGLQQHSMQAYLEQLKIKRMRAEKVDYQPEFNLFRLFSQ